MNETDRRDLHPMWESHVHRGEEIANRAEEIARQEGEPQGGFLARAQWLNVAQKMAEEEILAEENAQNQDQEE
ncbi:hypothetical protein [Natronoglycomyces albus]|uniref:Uncharacterized protein n=1 Tax=Natronoglycomyces albus TaxID=2811108 RepID=A0A895XYB8_9ACTN|nr:hypothetical protein [Natronoglycomyces albus]QSB07180.1 hypothetical protein JQS30_16890 [Natronoglycomyces albus]